MFPHEAPGATLGLIGPLIARRRRICPIHLSSSATGVLSGAARCSHQVLSLGHDDDRMETNRSATAALAARRRDRARRQIRSATASVATLGLDVLVTKAFVLAVLGVAGVGLMNLTVSFSLAMFVATRACGIQSPERHAIYAAVARRVMRRPAGFLFPTNGARELAAPLPGKLGT